MGGERRPVGDSPANVMSQKDLQLCQPCTLRNHESVAKNHEVYNKSTQGISACFLTAVVLGKTDNLRSGFLCNPSASGIIVEF